MYDKNKFQAKNITNFPEKLNTFICNIKAKVPKLKKVGILVSGIQCDLYGYPDSKHFYFVLLLNY